MSLYSLATSDNMRRRAPAQHRGLRLRGDGRAAGSRSAGDVARAVASYVPSEAIVAYTTLLGLATPIHTPLAKQNFTGRWVWAAVVAVLAVVVVVGLDRRDCRKKQKPFQFPTGKVVIVVVAFAGWLCALPGTPVNSLDNHSPQTGLGFAVVINLALYAAGLFVDSP